jgi:hypothetical protein
MSAMYTEYYVQLVNARTKKWINDDTGKFIVMTVDVPTLATIYADDKGTMFTGFTAASGVSVTMTDGVIRFWTTSDVTSVDVSVITSNGEAIFIKSLTPSQHVVYVDRERSEQTMILPYYNFIPTPYTSASITATGSAWGIGVAIPANSTVKDCFVRVSTLGTGALVNVGISGTPSGLLQMATADATGHKYPLQPELTSATATFARGALLMASTTGITRIKYVAAAATNIVFFNYTATTLAAHKGWIYITYDKFPV